MSINTHDIISRQEAINALGEQPLARQEGDDYMLGRQNQWVEDVDAIKKLSEAKQYAPGNFRFGKWAKKKGPYMTPGGTPIFVCAQCGGSEHLHGVEFSRRKMVCDTCGCINSYPWEKTIEESE